MRDQHTSSFAFASRAFFVAVTVAICAFTVVDAAVAASSGDVPRACGGYGLSCPLGWECCGNASAISSSCYSPQDSQCCGAATSDFVCPATRECCVSDDGQRKSCCAPGNCTGDGTCGVPTPPAPVTTVPSVPTPVPCPEAQQCGSRCLSVGESCCYSTWEPDFSCAADSVCCFWDQGRRVHCCPGASAKCEDQGKCSAPAPVPTPIPAPTAAPCPAPGTPCGERCCSEHMICCSFASGSTGCCWGSDSGVCGNNECDL